MTRPAVLVLAATLLAGCANRTPLAEPSGPYRALNPGRWQPAADDLRDDLRDAPVPASSAADR